MADDKVHISKIEKQGSGGTHAMHVEGVVKGEQVSGYITMETFSEAQKHGPGRGVECVTETLRDLQALRQEQRDQTRR